MWSADCVQIRQYALVPSDEPVLRATTSDGGVYNDPSEDLLYMLFEDIDRGEADFLIVKRLNDGTGQTYAQATRDDNGAWIVERREGAPDAHFTATFPDLRSAHAAITAWAFDTLGADDASWDKVSFE